MTLIIIYDIYAGVYLVKNGMRAHEAPGGWECLAGKPPPSSAGMFLRRKDRFEIDCMLCGIM